MNPVGVGSLFFRQAMSVVAVGTPAYAEAQRARLLQAAVDAVAEKGYGSTSVQDIVTGAGVSRRTFYEQFADKEDCLLAAFDTACTNVLLDVAAAVRDAETPTWRDRVRVSIEAYIDALVREPSVAQVLVIDILAAGPRAHESRKDIARGYIAYYEAMHRVAVAEEPGIPDVPRVWFGALVYAVDGLVREHMITDGVQGLRTLSDDLAALAVTMISVGRAGFDDGSGARGIEQRPHSSH